MRNDLEAFAKTLGFEKIAVASPEPVERWRAAAQEMAVQTGRLTDAPDSLLPGARCVVMLVMPYAPYEVADGEPEIDAYYVASNAAHAKSGAVAGWLHERGFAALASPTLPYKPLLERTGLGRYGANGLVAVGEWGSRVALQAVLTDAPLEIDRAEPGCTLDAACEGCGRCARACPVGALPGDGRVRADLCLRALMNRLPILEPQRRHYQSLLGCDICQRVCPRNRAVRRVPMPAALAELVPLRRLLAGEHEGLGDWVGGNYARADRVYALAAMMAGNLRRDDLRPLLTALAEHSSPAVAEHAAWAVDRL